MKNKKLPPFDLYSQKANKVLSKIFSENDFTVAITGFAIIENLIGQLLKKALKHNEKSKYNMYNQIDNTSSEIKINLCYNLGLLNEYESDIIHSMRNIRNYFAHNYESSTFDSDLIIADIKTVISLLPLSFLEPFYNGPNFKKKYPNTKTIESLAYKSTVYVFIANLTNRLENIISVKIDYYRPEAYMKKYNHKGIYY